MTRNQRWSQTTLPSYQDGEAPEVEVVFRDVNSLDDHERAAKRRRIEKHAQIYLRGGTILLQSTSLSSSLNGWRNPWRSRGQEMVDEQSIPPEKTPSPILFEGEVVGQKSSVSKNTVPRSPRLSNLHASLITLQHLENDVEDQSKPHPRRMAKLHWEEAFTAKATCEALQGGNIIQSHIPTRRQKASSKEKESSPVPKKRRSSKPESKQFALRNESKWNYRAPSFGTKINARRNLRTPSPDVDSAAAVDTEYFSPLSEADSSRLPKGSSLDTPLRHSSSRHVLVSATIDKSAALVDNSDKTFSETLSDSLLQNKLPQQTNDHPQLLGSSKQESGACLLTCIEHSLAEQLQQDSVTETGPQSEAVSNESTPNEYRVTGTDEDAMLALAQEYSDLGRAAPPKRAYEDPPARRHADHCATPPLVQRRSDKNIEVYEVPTTPGYEERSESAVSANAKELLSLENVESDQHQKHVSMPKHQNSKAYSPLNFAFLANPSAKQSTIPRSPAADRESVPKPIPRLSNIRSPKRKWGSQARRSSLQISLPLPAITKSKTSTQATFCTSGWMLSKPVPISDEDKNPSQTGTSLMEINVKQSTSSRSSGSDETSQPKDIPTKRSSMKEWESLAQSNSQIIQELNGSAPHSSLQLTAPVAAALSYQMGQHMFTIEHEADNDEQSVDAILNSVDMSFLEVDYRF